MEVLPHDQYNAELVANAHPQQWTNPTPSGRYNLVAIGGGTAGIISALGTAGLGGRAALVERHLLGGDCLNYGCVPSKALIRASRAVYQSANSAEFGVRGGEAIGGDFAQAMERLRRLRAKISHHDSAQRFASLGADVFLGSARFTGPDSLQVDGRELHFARAVIATGGRAAAPSIEGLEAAGYLTNETVFSLTELPRRLIVVGAGPIGCELAQAFARFGSQVHLVQRGPTLLAKEDSTASIIIQRQFEREGIRLYLGWNTVRANAGDDGKQLHIERNGQAQVLAGDAILVAVGRTPNVEGLELEAAGVQYDAHGVHVDDHLRTANPRIYAAGDVCTRYQFTHVADAMARVCVQNALFPFPKKRMSGLVIPRCTYTDPEVAHVGLTPAEAAERGIAIDSYREELQEVDRAILDGEDEGFAVVHTQRGQGTVVGCTIVGSHAGEMIGEITLLMAQKLSLGALAGTIHCYPTQVEVLKRIADAYSRTRLTPTVAAMMKRWLAWRR